MPQLFRCVAWRLYSVAWPGFALLLHCIVMLCNSIAELSLSLPFHCCAYRRGADLMRFRADLRAAVPLRVNAFQSFSSAILSPATPYHGWSMQRHCLAAPGRATPLPCNSAPRSTMPLRFRSLLCYSLARLFSAQLFLCFAILSHAVPLRCHTSISIAAAVLRWAIPQLCVA